MTQATDLIEIWKIEFLPSTPILLRIYGGWNLHGILEDLSSYNEDNTFWFRNVHIANDEIEHMEIDSIPRTLPEEIESLPWKEIDQRTWRENIRGLLIGIVIGLVLGTVIIGGITLTS